MTAVTVTDRSALAAALRNLKLSGMLDTLDARLAQAHAGELGHLDFLQVLCQDEISRRETMSLARRIRRARFETEATLEGFDFGASPKLPAAQIRDLAALRWLAGGESVILYGPVGVGKSHVAQALAHLAIRAGADARFLKTSRALAHLAGGKADHTWDRRLAELTRPAVLVRVVHPRQQHRQRASAHLDPGAGRQVEPTTPIAPHNGFRCLGPRRLVTGRLCAEPAGVGVGGDTLVH